MNINALEQYEPLFTAETRYVLLFGGRGRGGSTAGSQFPIFSALSWEYSRCAIMRDVLNDVRSSIYQETKDRIEEMGISDDVSIADNSMTINFPNGNSIEGKGFKKSSSKQTAKLKSLASYNIIIIEEADETDEHDFNQLDVSVRTKKGRNIIVLIFNMPDKNNFIIKKWFNLVEATPENLKKYYGKSYLTETIEGFFLAVPKLEQKDTTYIFGTYHDNIQNLNQSAINSLEGYKNSDVDYYNNMILGLVSEGARGRVFKNWKPITNKEFEELPYYSKYGLDFGFTNDPTALVEIKDHNNNVWVRELIYETGLTNQDISAKLEAMGLTASDEITADSAEPKSIEELGREGWNIKGAVKGADSIKAGISYLKSKNVHYTESSKNIVKELENYKWALDKNKEPTNKPIDDWNHGMDAIRYGVYTETNNGEGWFV